MKKFFEDLKEKYGAKVILAFIMSVIIGIIVLGLVSYKLLASEGCSVTFGFRNFIINGVTALSFGVIATFLSYMFLWPAFNVVNMGKYIRSVDKDSVFKFGAFFVVILMLIVVVGFVGFTIGYIFWLVFC